MNQCVSMLLVATLSLATVACDEPGEKKPEASDCEARRRAMAAPGDKTVDVVPGDGIGTVCLGDPVAKDCRYHLGWCDRYGELSVFVLDKRIQAVAVDARSKIRAPAGLRIGMPEAKIPLDQLGPVMRNGEYFRRPGWDQFPPGKVIEVDGLRLELTGEKGDWRVERIIVYETEGQRDAGRDAARR